MTPRGRTTAAGERQPWRIAALFVLPYLLLGIGWLGSNPAGAAPDEDAHLVKALGVARLDFGTDHRRGNLKERNAAITTRIVTIPSRLSPSGLTCFKHEPLVTAACQPNSPPKDIGNVSAATTVGSYPPFLYLPMGLAAEAADTPVHAFVAARSVTLIETVLLLWLACAHLVRWLGRRALAGMAIALTPMCVFCMAIVSTSGLEIFGALGVASVIIVASRSLVSLKAWRTQLTLLISGTSLVLSRQFGAVTMGAFVILLLALGGWRPFWEQFKRLRLPFLAMVAAVGTSTFAMVLWEWKLDNPGHVGPLASGDALAAFARYLPYLVQQGVGEFGWLDTRMPIWSALVWVILLVVLTDLAFINGRRRDRWMLGVTMTVTIGVAYVIHALLFFPTADVQGRHMLPLFVFGPILAGVIVTDSLGKRGLVRMFSLGAFLLPAIQFLALYFNARRYAVGEFNQPIIFFGHAQWDPPLGWYPWLSIGFVGCVLLMLVLIFIGKTTRPLDQERPGWSAHTRQRPPTAEGRSRAEELLLPS